MVKQTVENLDVAIGGETFEVEEMYPVYNNDAKLQGEKEAEKSTYYALEAEKIHAKMYRMARELAAKDKDAEINTVYVCPVCGYTVEGGIPDYCPVCGVKKEIFKTF
jgi:rubrerythrin